MTSDLHRHVELDGIRFAPIAPDDLPRIAEAAARASAWLWATYPPFLLCYGHSSSRAVLIGQWEEALLVLLRRKMRGYDHLDLLVPPLAREPVRALEEIVPRLRAYNGELGTRVLWADLPTAAWARERAGWQTTPYEREYVYSRYDLLARTGGAFRPLRKRLARCAREADPYVRPYRPEDSEACLHLLRRWQDEREPLVGPVLDFGYTRAALELAGEIGRHLMTGVVAEVHGEICAFAFGGALRPGVGAFFLLKSNPHILGLAETMRLALIERLEGCELINDAGDLGRPGLAQHKRMFRPVAFVPTYKLAYAP